ncbi:unnamed protein product [Polarella glacialis]|uniref:Uncharacterized protein n=2 Tax=Polarella glacialis TaxID=89957 RepID=A0A813LIN2_POLGL|nr:unnamed protein product [Polarella glacialis]
MVADVIRFCGLHNRTTLINLDSDGAEHARMELAGINRSDISDREALYSIRRVLADAEHLPWGSARLLLDTSVSFQGDVMQEPASFIDVVRGLTNGQAAYMTRNEPACFARFYDSPLPAYMLPAWLGPQCPGLIDNFVYLSPGLSLTVDDIASKLSWYLTLPPTPSRHSPPCTCCEHSRKAGQFALMLSLGDGGCVALDEKSFVDGDELTGETQAIQSKGVMALLGQQLQFLLGGRRFDGGKVEKVKYHSRIRVWE